MKSLKEFIVEGILDIDDNEKNFDKNIKEQIIQFIKDNFKVHATYKISKKPNKDGKYEVSSKGSIEVENEKITSLTNGLFVWTEVDGDFNCSYCNSLTSLEGAPEKVGGDFLCYGCDSLTSLKGAPKEIDGYFSCNYCHSLKTLEGAPEKVGGSFYCNSCSSLKILKGAPEKVGGDFSCDYCDSLKTLKGAPEKVGGGFYCNNCGKRFTKEDVKKVSDAKGEIYC